MLKVERVPIDSLNLDPNNARKHSERNLDAIKGSLNKFGQLKNIVVWKNTILAGNGTYAAAKRLNWDTIDIVRVDHMSFTEATAYSLSDNKTASLAEWDDDILKGQLDALLNEGFEIEDIGFDIDDVSGVANFEFDGKEKTYSDNKPLFSILVQFSDFDKMNELYEELIERKIFCKVLD